MRILFRSTNSLMAAIRDDLRRPHKFAGERVGFVSVRATFGTEYLVLLAQHYYPVADSDYLPDPMVGARIGPNALRLALETALLNPVGMFHVHAHDVPGPLRFSGIDLREQENFVPDFFKVRSELPHGALVLNASATIGRVWLAAESIHTIDEVNTMGEEIRATRTPSSEGRLR